MSGPHLPTLCVESMHMDPGVPQQIPTNADGENHEHGVKPTDSNLTQTSPAIYPGAGWRKERRNDGTVFGFSTGGSFSFHCRD